MGNFFWPFWRGMLVGQTLKAVREIFAQDAFMPMVAYLQKFEGN